MQNLGLSLQQIGLGNTFRWSEKSGSWLTPGYTSMLGNTYFESIRVSEHLVIRESLGQGYCYLFLNRLKIYTKDGTLLAEGGYHNCVYSQETMKERAVGILVEAMLSAARRQGVTLSRQQLKRQAAAEIDSSLKLSYQEAVKRLGGR